MARVFLLNVPGCTFHVWLPGAKGSQESSSSCGFIRHHLQHHGVGGGDEGTWSERPAEAAQFLHQTGVTVVDVEVVVAAGGVCLQVKEAEREHDHVTFRDLDGGGGGGRLAKYSVKQKQCRGVIYSNTAILIFL